MALNRSRPCASVPSRKRASLPSCQNGGSSESSRSKLERSNGSWGAIRGANRHARATIVSSNAASAAPGRSRIRPARRRRLRGTARSWRRLQADTRIEEKTDEIDDGVGDDEEQAHQHEIGGDKRDVGAGHRLKKEEAHPRPLEHRLGQQCVGDQRADLQSADGDERQQRVAQRMDEPDAERRDAPLARAVRT